MKEKSFWDVYDEIMQDRDRWNYFSRSYPEQTAEDLFSGTKALDYIKSTFIIGGKAKVLEIVNDKRFVMTQYRSNHTLSAYLLGIAIKERMHIDMRSLPRISEYPNKCFLYFWSLTCLYHDFAFALECETKKHKDHYLTQMSTIDDFLNYFHIKYSLLDKSGDSALIRNYYQYIVDIHGKVDHGIAGALLFFNAMMDEYYTAKQLVGEESNVTFFYEGKRFSKDFEKHILLICNTIAKHNMWRADSNTLDFFRQYNLYELIPNEDQSHIVYLDSNSEDVKEKMLFLLGLVDTIEPIKNLGREKLKYRLKNPYLVLEKMKIKFDYRNKSISICCPDKYLNDYYSSIEPIKKWMGVTVVKEGNQIKLTIQQKENNKMNVA